jgi:hypothetical protein
MLSRLCSPTTCPPVALSKFKHISDKLLHELFPQQSTLPIRARDRCNCTTSIQFNINFRRRSDRGAIARTVFCGDNTTGAFHSRTFPGASRLCAVQLGSKLIF